MKFSHIQFKVNELHRAVTDFRKLGFVVEYGKEPKQATNAFIWFGQGAFFEIITMPKIAEKLAYPLGILYGKGMRLRWQKYANLKGGIADIGIEGKTPQRASMYYLKQIRDHYQKAGISCSKIMTESRKAPDKPRTQFSFFVPDNPNLPLVTSTYSVMQKPMESHHENGITGIKWVKVQCNSQEKLQFQKMLGDETHIKFVEGEEFKLCSICFEGAKEILDEAYLHGLIVEYE